MAEKAQESTITDEVKQVAEKVEDGIDNGVKKVENGVEKILKKITKPYFLEMKDKGRMVVIVDGKIYDLTDFYANHPGGPQIIEDHKGLDATESFNSADHPKSAIRDMEQYVVGEYVKPKLFKTLEEISDHNRREDLWLLINNKVYDVSNFDHPGN